MNKKIMKQAGFEKEVELVKNKMCPCCFQKINFKDFKDELSRKEYGISGVCQVCQDKIFGDKE